MEINDDVKLLACLLASYEMDEPHVDLPDLKDEDSHYPEVDWEEFEGWMKEEHCGDCINLPAPCIRCYAEMILHKAKWIDERL